MVRNKIHTNTPKCKTIKTMLTIQILFKYAVNIYIHLLVHFFVVFSDTIEHFNIHILDMCAYNVHEDQQ